MATERRKKNQKGQEIIEFGIVGILLIPLLLGAITVGISCVRWLQATHICRDLDDMYIHGNDFTTYGYQQLAARLAQGMNLQIGTQSAFGNLNGPTNGHNWPYTNTGNGGDGIVTMTQIEYIGSTTDPNCTAVGASNCVNHDNFVYLQQIRFGNGTLASQGSMIGTPTTTSINSSGYITSDVASDSGAKLQGAAQTTMQALWQNAGSPQAALVDGQVIYMVEVYFQSSIALGYNSPGTYARYFF